jgi:predicted amidohydrolase
MKISIAQLQSVKGDIPANIGKHLALIDLAVSQGADALFFPELSLTGYEPTLAKDLVTNQEDARFDVLQKMSDTHTMVIGVGLPTVAPLGIHISMILFQPGGARQTYAKQQLHTDEFPYFVSGDEQTIVTVAGQKIAPAICYESLQPAHADHAYTLGAEIYAASVAKSQNGVDKAMAHYPAMARKFSMPVLMANCVGYCDNFMSVGKSSVWTKRGDLIGQLDDRSEGILVFDTKTETTIAQTLKL